MTRCFLRHESIDETLLDYCCGTLEESRRAAVETHVAECEACGRFVAEQQALWSSLDAWQDVAVPADFDERLLKRIAQEERKPSWRAAIGRWADRVSLWDWKPAAALATCALALVLFWNRGAETPQPAAPVAAQAPAVVDVDAVESTLEDLDLLTPVSYRAPSGAF